MATDTRRRESGILLRGSMLNLAGGGVQSIAGFGTIFVLTRLLGGGTALGAFLTAVAGINLAGRLGQLGTGTGIIRFVAQSDAAGDHRETRRILRVGILPALVVSLAWAAVLLLQADRLAPFIADPGATDVVADYLRWFAPILPAIALLGSLANSTRAFGTMRDAALADNVLRPGLQVTGLTILLLLAVDMPAPISVAYWGPTVVAVVVLVMALRRLLRARPVPGEAPAGPWLPLIRSYWAYTFPRSVSGVFATVIEWSDVLFIAGLAGTAQAGIYTAATRLVILGRTVQNSATNALRPQISRLLGAGETGAAQATYHLAATWSMMLTWPWFLAMAIFAEDVLTILGPEFAVAAPAIRILAIGWLFGTALGPVTAVLEMAGKSTWSMVDLGLAMVINVGLNILLIPRLGLSGAALAWLASITVNNVLPAWQVHRVTGLTPFGRTARQVAIVAVATFLVIGLPVRFLAPPGVVPALLASVAAGMLYLALLWRFVPQAQLRGLVQTMLRRGGTGRPATTVDDTTDQGRPRG